MREKFKVSFRLVLFTHRISLVRFYKQLGLVANDGGDGEGEGDKAGHQGGGGALVLVAEGGVTQAQGVAL